MANCELNFMMSRIAIGSRVGNRITALLFLFLSLKCMSLCAEEQRLLSDPPIESFLVSCSENPKIHITAPDGEMLRPSNLEARSNGNLVAGFVSLMKLYCPQFKRITFVGTVNNSLWFAGMTSEAQGWRLVGLHAAP